MTWLWDSSDFSGVSIIDRDVLNQLFTKIEILWELENHDTYHMWPNYSAWWYYETYNN